MCLQGRAGQLRSFFILFPQNERCVLSPPRARPSHWAQNPLTRTEQGSTGQPLIRMTKLYCFHTNTWSNQNTHLTRHTAAHIHNKKWGRLYFFLPSHYVCFCLDHIHMNTQRCKLCFPWSSLQHKNYEKSFGIYCAIFHDLRTTSYLSYICFQTCF